MSIDFVLKIEITESLYKNMSEFTKNIFQWAIVDTEFFVATIMHLIFNNASSIM